MRRIVVLLFSCLLLTSTLIALAGGSDENFVHTLPEELVDSAAPVTVPSEGVAFCTDDHHIGKWVKGEPLLNDDYQWIVESHCSVCGAYGGWQYLTW